MSDFTLDDARTAVSMVREENLKELIDTPLDAIELPEDTLAALQKEGFVSIKDMYEGMSSMKFLKTSPHGDVVRQALTDNGLPDPFWR